MTIQQKTQVRDALVRYIAGFDTQALAAASLQGISPSLVSQVKTNNWSMISDHLWQQLARQVGFYCGDWKPADTSSYVLLNILFNDAQHFGMTYGIIMGRGVGKTFAAANYLKKHEQVLYVSCAETWTCRDLLMALGEATGTKARGTLPELARTLTEYLASQDVPVLIIDDAQRLKDRVFHLMLKLANSLHGIAGIALMGTETLRERITGGRQLGKPGYNAFFNAMGRRFVTVPKLGLRDIALICNANGMDDPGLIHMIAEECGGDLHAAPQLLHKYNVMKIAA